MLVTDHSEKISGGRALVSSPACKELGRHQSHLYNNKKSEQAKYQKLFLDPSEHRGEATGKTVASKIVDNR